MHKVELLREKEKHSTERLSRLERVNQVKVLMIEHMKEIEGVKLTKANDSKTMQTDALQKKARTTFMLH